MKNFLRIPFLLLALLFPVWLTAQQGNVYGPAIEPGYAQPPAGAPVGYQPLPGAAPQGNVGYNPYNPQGMAGLGAIGASQAPAAPEVSDHAAVIDDMRKIDNTHKLKSNDVIRFRIVEEKTPSKTLRVMASGEVLVPHVGLVVAKDYTMQQLAYIVKQELEKTYFKQATVIIALDQNWADRNRHFQNQRNHYNRNQGGYYDPTADQIVIFGQVGRQGRYNIPGEGALTISTAILQAGGFARFANKKKVRIYRKIAGDEKNRRVILVDVDRIMRRGDLNKDIELRPDDVIIVPEKLINF